MTYRTFGRALALIAGSLGATLGLTSCSNDHTVGYIYVLGTTVNGQPGGAINAFREDNNNGNLKNVSGSPSSSGGTNPIRAVIPSGDRFMYVLNAGAATTDGTGNTTYSSGNITIFTIGGYGQLQQQIQYQSQGFGSKRIAVDSSGSHLFVLDQYSPVGITAGGTTSPTGVTVAAGGTPPPGYPCQDPANPQVYHPVGDITVFTIDPSTGRLAVVPNARQQNLSYFQVGCNPVDFRITGAYLFTMDAGAVSNGDVQTVYTQALASNGQLSPTQTTTQTITANGTSNITAITGDNAGKYIYLIDTNADLLYLYTIGTGGALIPVNGSPYDNSQHTQAGGPVQSIVDSTGKYLFVVNGGPTVSTTTAGNADISGYNINATTGYFDTAVLTSPFVFDAATISGPVCIFEDPTNQYIYSAGSLDNSITGRKLDPGTGTLKDLSGSVAFPTVGTPSWCLAVSSAL